MKKILCFLFILILYLNTGCEDDYEFLATYEVTFIGTWDAVSHPANFPNSDHFSPVVGMVHKGTASIFEPGSLPSPGIEKMAETGGVSTIANEISAIIDSGIGFEYILGTGLNPGTDSAKVIVVVNHTHSKVSLVSMIAPSPDWFVAVRNVDLLENDSFIEKLIINASTYDAGSDNGTNFSSPNSNTLPKEPIALITSPPLGNGATVSPPLGYFRFVKL